MRRYIKWISVTTITLILATLFYLYPAPHNRILNIQNYLITVGGIISAFVIAYLASKIFNVRSERAGKQIEIDAYSEKLTLFRRLLYYVMKSRNFWVRYDDISKFKNKYSGLNYERLHSQGDDQSVNEFYFNERDISQSTIDLYVAMEAISGDPNPSGSLPWAIDKSASFDYPLNELRTFRDPMNQIWYYLEGRYAKHGVGRFNDTGISPLYQEDVNQILERIDIRYRGKEFHRTILADLASEFYELYIPKLFNLTKQNTGVPQSLKVTFNSLLVIMVFGVLLPIIAQSLCLPDKVDTYLTLSFVLVTSIALIVFIWDFYRFLEEEVHVVETIKTTR